MSTCATEFDLHTVPLAKRQALVDSHRCLARCLTLKQSLALMSSIACSWNAAHQRC